MKDIKELRNQLNFHPQELSSSIRYFKDQNIDFDVYLPSKGINLQREFVWNLEQKRELINSVLMSKHIPHCAIINTVDEVWQIIDGKQRLSSILNFIDNKFTIELENNFYLFSELPDEYQRAINFSYFRYYVVNEESDNTISDDDKIRWFKFINFAGTPQEKEHYENLSK